MTTQENSIDANVFDNDKLVLTSSAVDFLNTASKWSIFIAIIGFLFVASLLTMAFMIGNLISQLPMQLPIPTIVFTGVFLFAAIVLFFPVFFLFRFSMRTQKAIKTKDSVALASAFQSLKAHYMYIGILIIIYIALSILGMVLSNR